MKIAHRPTGPHTRYEPIGATHFLAARRFFSFDTTELTYGPVDLVAVERAINGGPVALSNEAERYLAARGMAYLEVPLKRIARRLNMPVRSLNRWAKAGWVDRDILPDGRLRNASREPGATT